MKSNHWAGIAERGSAIGMRAILFLLNAFGYTAACGGLVPVVGYFYLTGRVSRRASRDYHARLHRKYPQSVAAPSHWRCYLHHLHFAMSTLDRILFWQGALRRFRFEVENRSSLKQLAQKGGMFISAHLGSFDALRILALEDNVKIHVVMYRSNAVKINAMINAQNPDTNLRVLELQQGDMHGIFALKECVDRGEMVAVLGDRIPPSGRLRVCEADFLGDRAPFPQNAWILAHLLECPVYLAFGLRTGRRRYRIVLEPIADRVEIPRRNREACLRPYIEEYAKRLEELCRRHPYLWFNFYDFWSIHE